MELDVDVWEHRYQNELLYNEEKFLNTEECESLVDLLHRIQGSVKFFKAHLNDFQKAEAYLKRYEVLKERLTTLVCNLVLKVIKEALQKVNLTLVALQQQNTFDLQVSALVCKPVGSKMCRILMTNGLDC